MESPFAEIQEANEEANQSDRQKAVGISKKPSQATDQTCEGKCSRATFAALFAFQSDEGAGT
jgi:hypothetical protein